MSHFDIEVDSIRKFENILLPFKKLALLTISLRWDVLEGALGLERQDSTFGRAV